MKDFVNPKKRSIQLPAGSKDLADVLLPKRQKRAGPGECDYCGAPAVAIAVAHAIPGAMDEEIHRWCEQCQRDLAEFASAAENKLPDDLDVDDDAAMERASRLLADIQRRRKRFMHQRVRGRRQ
ncbi:MAG TPA: hypothetical protein VNH84_21915 [Candidatus Saccharimonadales bacterium]|nr:hypothetical protein [Candidatus Saccharimonadales bacterium]